MLDVVQAIILGLVQGIAEWLPISSKSQVMLVAVSAFGLQPAEALAYSLFLHIGTLMAALVYFRREIVEIVRGADRALRDYLIVSTACTAILGVPLFLVFRTSFALTSGEILVALIGVGLIVTGILLKSAKQVGVRKEGTAGLKDALLVGLAQAFSVLPGISRNGVTMAPLLWRGFSQESTLRLSFLMSIPAVVGAEIGFSLIEGVPKIGAVEGLVLTGTAFVVGLLSISTLLAVSRRISFWLFCIALGLLALVPFIISRLL